MQLFYNPTINPNDKQIHFGKEESKHLAKVLRKKTGDLLNVTNGKGVLFTVELIEVNPRQCSAEIKKTKTEQPKPYRLHLAVAPTKMNSRYEWFLEKTTEIGFDEITPIICDHSERKSIKKERFERVLQSAMKQSLQSRLPVLNDAVSFHQFIENEENDQKFIAYCGEEEKELLKTSLNPNKNTTILIGPEGDFSEKEIRSALENRFKPVSLGNNRLRTETAAIVACHTVVLFSDQ